MAPLALLLAAAGCGDGPTYELRWTLGCASGLGPCDVATARDCSSVGVGQIEVEATQGSRTARRVFLCFGAEGASGRGPGLSPGPAQLTLSSLSAAGRRLPVEAASTRVEIPSEGVVQHTIDLPVPAACADGVDNDGDRQVDLFDPGCSDETDTDEAETDAEADRAP